MGTGLYEGRAARLHFLLMAQQTDVCQERSGGFLQPGREKPGAGAPQSCVPCHLRDGSPAVTPPCRDGWAVTILLPPLLP